MLIRFFRGAVLALLLVPSLGTAQGEDFTTALLKVTSLAEQGDVKAQNILGVMYGEGHGVPQDYAESAKWYRLAAEQGDAFAQAKLGFMYGEGQGVSQDYAEESKWFRLAAKQGNAIAQYNLGFQYYKGEGVLLDMVMAHMWLNLAAANGSDTAMAVEARDLMAQSMTPADLSEAQRRARVCLASSYQDCD